VIQVVDPFEGVGELLEMDSAGGIFSDDEDD
jgi:hypothetical protein